MHPRPLPAYPFRFMPKVSFVIPAHNEERLIARTLTSIHRAARDASCDYEIVVANDASTDDTVRVAERHGARTVTVAHRQIAATRNSGARAALGEWIIFVDADTIVTGRAVRSTLRELRRGAAGGGAPVRFDGEIPWHARLALPSLMLLFRLAGMAAGCYLYCTRQAFDRTGGFNESFYASEELWMSAAIKRVGRFVIVRDAVITSGRKMRTHSAAEIYGLFLRSALMGPSSVQRREGLDLWYGERRADPGDQA